MCYWVRECCFHWNFVTGTVADVCDVLLNFRRFLSRMPTDFWKSTFLIYLGFDQCLSRKLSWWSCSRIRIAEETDLMSFKDYLIVLENCSHSFGRTKSQLKTIGYSSSSLCVEIEVLWLFHWCLGLDGFVSSWDNELIVNSRSSPLVFLWRRTTSGCWPSPSARRHFIAYEEYRFEDSNLSSWLMRWYLHLPLWGTGRTRWAVLSSCCWGSA